MVWRLILVALVVTAVVAKTRGLETVALYALLAAIPPAAVVALLAFDDLLEGRPSVLVARLQVVAASIGLALVVAGAAVL